MGKRRGRRNKGFVGRTNGSVGGIKTSLKGNIKLSKIKKKNMPRI